MNEIPISVITPCFNHGAFLIEAIKSVDSLKTWIDVEHIIVDDGSFEAETIKILNQLKSSGYNIIFQSNAGPANARNTAILNAKGKYILPLDADNKLIAEVFKHAFEILENDESIDVVYTNAKRFGEVSDIWMPGEINPVKLLAGNYIDTCSLIRKSVLFDLGCYDDQIPIHGNEDWELWLRFYFHKKNFYWLQENGFEYRVANNSLSKKESAPNQKLIDSYIVKKYALQYALYYQKLFREKKGYDNLQFYLKKNRFKSIFKILIGKKITRY